MDNLNFDEFQPSFEQREHNRTLGKGDGNCLLCSRRMVMDSPVNAMVHLCTDGTLYPVDEDHEGQPEDQGWFEIGPSCARKLPKAYVAFPNKEN